MVISEKDTLEKMSYPCIKKNVKSNVNYLCEISGEKRGS